MPVFGYPTLVLGALLAHLRASEATRPFVKNAFLLGIAGECGALSGIVHLTGAAGSTLASALNFVVGAVA
ncbi:hypothetical protein C453_04049 [Haloferax elongans ATCC BAA-1513]|uniref:Uncharacterized protein n=1 Tax=Haloferax elongans ATCC BAA-1513 TaxID=1230453 RepID=M0HWL5_HALEO|nr:hypothetical protein [Haloferax elongans]ELZ87494.1 hypothetical protein C453_04049 [Haloferax elongans ATCC BAA-1513]